jgi:hypothetical protein
MKRNDGINHHENRNCLFDRSSPRYQFGSSVSKVSAARASCERNSWSLVLRSGAREKTHAPTKRTHGSAGSLILRKRTLAGLVVLFGLALIVEHVANLGSNFTGDHLVAGLVMLTAAVIVCYLPSEPYKEWRRRFCRRPPPRLILEIDIGELLPVAVAHDPTVWGEFG